MNFLFTKQVSCVNHRPHHVVTHLFLVPTSPAVASRSPHDGHGSTGALQSQDAINRDIIIPQLANSDVPRSIATVPRNVTGTTELLAQSMPPDTTLLSRSGMDSTSHNPTPSSLDILANTTQLTSGSPASPSFPLSAQRQSESPPAEAPSLTLRIVNLTEQDTFRSTSSSDIGLFQSLRTARAPSPALVHPETPLSYGTCHAPLLSSLGYMDDHAPPFTLSQEPLIQPLPQEVIIPSPSSPSKAATQEASYPATAEPGQAILSQTSVRPFPGDRSTEQNTVNTPYPPQLTAVTFPEPCYFLDGSVPTPVPGTSPLSSDTNSYPHLTTPFSLKSRRAVSLPASPGHVRQNLLLIPSRFMLIFLRRALEDRPLKMCTRIKQIRSRSPRLRHHLMDWNHVPPFISNLHRTQTTTPPRSIDYKSQSPVHALFLNQL